MTVVRFDTEEHLNDWMASPERLKLIDEAASFTEDVHARTVRSGFEQWFQMSSEADAPVWKQNMLTLAALYPVVFLFGYFVQTPLLQERLGLPFYLALFFSNVASVTILTWLAPWLGAQFGWWLRPAGHESVGSTLLGIAAIVALYALCLLIFSRVP